MRRTRVVAATALVATAAMVLAACGSSPGQKDNSSAANPPGSSQESPAETPDESTAPTEGGGETSTPPDSSAPAPGEVGGSACGIPHGPYDQPDGDPSGTVKAGFNQLAYSLNATTGHGNSTYNADPLYIMNGPGLMYYNDKNELINNDSFGTCTLDSLDPLTVTYKINDGVNWSDGAPVSAADLVLYWAAVSGHYNTEEAQYDENGELLPSSGVAFDAASDGAALITDFPKVSDDGKSVTFTYSDFYVDYDVNITIGVPAHVVAMKALGEDDPAKATADMMTLLQDTLGKVKDATADQAKQLKAIADFWNTGFDGTQMPEDPAVYVSNGAYKLTDWKKDAYMTFEADPNYTWGPKPQVKTIIWTYAPNPTGAVQSLQNGDLDIINPQATADVKASLDKLKDQGIETVAIDGATYEHVDLVFDNGGPFDPATYGGDADKAKAVRLAFLNSVPRQAIIDNIIKPLNPDVQLRQSFMMFPGQPGYDDMISQNGSADWADAGSDAAISRAKDLLAQAGVSTPIKVRMLYADNNDRRSQEYALIAASAAKAGFEVEDGKNADWGNLLSSTKTYDASLFAWQSTSTGVGQNPPNYSGENADLGTKWGQNNFGHFNSDVVNKAMKDLNTQKDTDKQFQDMLDSEKVLWAEGFGTLLYQYPDIVGFNSATVTGVGDAPLSPTFLWNYWDWKAAA